MGFLKEIQLTALLLKIFFSNIFLLGLELNRPIISRQPSLSLVTLNFLFSEKYLSFYYYKTFTQSILPNTYNYTLLIMNNSSEPKWIYSGLNATLLEDLRLQAQKYLASLPIQAQIAQFGEALKVKIQIEKQMVQQEQSPVQKGRGGNNIAQNIKKSFLSLLKKKISVQLFQEINVRFIQEYNIKSQKQNLIIYFLFLEVLCYQQKIERRLITELAGSIKDKIQKYIYNSTLRLEMEETRRQFHEKNRAEFQKFLELDLDFGKSRDFQDMIRQIGSLYLRKKRELAKAEAKIKKIIDSFSCLKHIFYESEISTEKQSKTMTEPGKQGSSKIKIIDLLLY